MITGVPEAGEQAITIPETLPLLPVRDLVVFPFMIVPLHVGRALSAAAVEAALERERLVVLAAQRDAAQEEPGPADLYPLGTVGMIMRVRRGEDGDLKILVQGLVKARVESFLQTSPYLQVRCTPLAEPEGEPLDVETEALMRSVKEGMELLAKHSQAIGPEVLMIIGGLGEPGRLADLVASHLGLNVAQAQELIELDSPRARLAAVNALLSKEVAVISVQEELQKETREDLDKAQREYILRQQLARIQSELGADDAVSELDELAARITAAALPAEAHGEACKQLGRLRRMSPDSAEATVARTYLDWLLDFPWGTRSEDNLDLQRARVVLDEDHHQLEGVKERILEHLAVRRLNPASRGPLLCFVGPPGVGKTSLGRSIARAMGRRFVRVSLGGVRDEAEIRGHRRTYVGAMPGRIVSGLAQARSANPVFMLDEIDKLICDQRGDPASALLEVLDPEQNHAFRDHYLGVPVDLSGVLFITTANQVDLLPAALRDRLEVLALAGYSEAEKLVIARRFLLPRALAEAGLGEAGIQLGDAALRALIAGYTREAGLRNLQRELAAVCRKLALRVASAPDGEQARLRRIGPTQLRRLLGPPRHAPDEALARDEIGLALGLAWTPVGGEVLHVEVTAMRGRPALLLTGQLGEVMKESAQAALSYVRTEAAALGVPPGFFEEHQLHVHVPAGALPKDGPSAGITIAVALASLASGRPVRHQLAMTGELTLRGRVLPVGGLREKLLAALRHDLREALVPAGNGGDLEELPAALRRGLTIHPVSRMSEVFAHALAPAPG